MSQVCSMTLPVAILRKIDPFRGYILRSPSSYTNSISVPVNFVIVAPYAQESTGHQTFTCWPW